MTDKKDAQIYRDGVRNATETAIGRQKRDKEIKWNDAKRISSNIPRWQDYNTSLQKEGRARND